MASDNKSTLKLLSSSKCFDGYLKRYSHQSTTTRCEMTFTIYIPPAAEKGQKVPAVWYLSGLTCTDENFIQKAGAQRDASRLGLVLVAPDTSPRGVKIEGDSDSWDFGVGAAFYVDAIEPKWNANYNMYSYVTKELFDLIIDNFPVEREKQSIMGHSMGGHGALICALRNPEKYTSVSAFAPISNPSQCPWGIKAFTGYLGEDQSEWKQYDATELVATYKGPDPHILIDQGTEDKFYKEKQLLPENFKAACEQVSIPLTVRMQEGYDHSYFFVSTFIADHLEYHAEFLKTDM